MVFQAGLILVTRRQAYATPHRSQSAQHSNLGLNHDFQPAPHHLTFLLQFMEFLISELPLHLLGGDTLCESSIAFLLSCMLLLTG